jgi:hypothetical protein
VVERTLFWFVAELTVRCRTMRTISNYTAERASAHIQLVPVKRSCYIPCGAVLLTASDARLAEDILLFARNSGQARKSGVR